MTAPCCQVFGHDFGTPPAAGDGIAAFDAFGARRLSGGDLHNYMYEEGFRHCAYRRITSIHVEVSSPIKISGEALPFPTEILDTGPLECTSSKVLREP